MSKQFVSFIEKDDNGKDASFVTFNKAHVVSAVYDAFRDTMFIVINDPTTVTRKFKQQFKDEKGRAKGGSFEAVGSFTENRSLPIQDRQNIVEVYNALNETTHSVDTFPGFKLNDQYRKEYEEAMEKKKQEEAAGKQSPIIDPNTQEPVDKSGRGLIIV